MTTTSLVWILPALAALAMGWFASDWFNKRKIKVLQDHIKAVRQTALEHANQARQQMGLLQAELAARPPMAPLIREQRAQAAAAVAQARRVTARMLAEGDGFQATDVSRHDFPSTEVME